MTSEKSYDVSQRLDAHIASGGFGPWTKWNPLASGWAVRGPYTGSWVRWAPGNFCVLSCWVTTSSSADGVTVGTIPATDSVGNPLRPAQAVQVVVVTDLLKTTATQAYFQITTAGLVLCYGWSTGASFGGVSAGWYTLDAM